MNKKRLIGIIAVFTACFAVAVIGKQLGREKTGLIKDQEGNVIAKVVLNEGKLQYDCKNGYEAYVDIVCEETARIIMKKENIDYEQAQKRIVDEEVQIKTSFDKYIYRKMEMAMKRKKKVLGNASATAISDTKGHLLACYSESVDGSNYVTVPTYAGSTIKPLSVYAPGIEKNKIHWSTMYLDSAYRQVENENGEWVDWPVNTEPYTNQITTVEDAVRKSNNAIAVKVLKDCGIKEACAFLENVCSIDVSEEKKLMDKEGEERILSNIALGYLENGVSLKEILADYQMFANGGKYYSIQTVERIETKSGKNYYKYKEEGKRAITPETAYIMNRLLKQVVSEGGSGESAMVQGLDVCGKTGTSSEYRDNWFVGMTPEYVCAVWYGLSQEYRTQNEAPGVFSDIVSAIDADASVTYNVPNGIERLPYCKKTGNLANEYCLDTGIGYFDSEHLPPKCICN